MTRFERELVSELEATGGQILDAVRKEGVLSEASESQLKSLLDKLSQAFVA